jgi:cysteine desulfurase
VNESSEPVYLDYQATTPVDGRVLLAMLPYFSQSYGNAASIDHTFGAVAAAGVEKARQQVADLLSVPADGVVFTSGATESNNMAILGLLDEGDGGEGHIITVETEHRAVLDPCLALENRGWRVTRLRVDGRGLLDPDQVGRAIARDTRLISIMAANNEIGVLSPIAGIAGLAREADVPLHCDATQAAGLMHLKGSDLGTAFISISAHKIYGPKGVGALVACNRRSRLKLHPRQFGGGHERGLRSGTLNVPGIVGLGEACSIAAASMDQDRAHMAGLRDQLWEHLKATVSGIELNGDEHSRLPNNLNVFIPEVNSRALVVQVKGQIAVSTGAACGSAKGESSHVIAALGHGPERAACSFRISLGRPTTESDITFAADAIISAVRLLG